MMNDDVAFPVPETLEESSWQTRVYRVSQIMLSTSGERKDAPFSSLSPPESFSYDNTSSNQCVRWIESDFCSSPPLARLVLLWIRSLFFKIIRTYGAAPVFLMLAPLVIGLAAGVLMGRRWERSQTTLRQKNKDGISGGSSFGMESRLFFIFHSMWSQIYIFFFATTGSDEALMTQKEDRVRQELKSDMNSQPESGVDIATVPKHIAVIMDGNRRYGKSRYGDATKGHWDGSRTLVDFSKWCIAEGIQILTVYAFSTENWNRDPAEVASLMALFCTYCDELRVEAIQRNIRLHVLSSETDMIPAHVKVALKRMVDETKHCEGGLLMNICLSYGSRGEIVNACRDLASEAAARTIQPDSITEQHITDRLLTCHCPDPDLVIRTSGEYRLTRMAFLAVLASGWNRIYIFFFATTGSDEALMTQKEDRVRQELKSDMNSQPESGVDIATVPKHIAVIMDGNRRYGKSRYGDATKGHWDGSRTLVDFSKWCIAEGIQILTVYAFSTENWNRDPAEVASLMALFCTYCDELRVEAIQRNIRLHVLSSETDMIPAHVKVALKRMVDETKHCEGGLLMNICLSYGSRGEIVNACRDLASEAAARTIQPDSITEQHITDRLLTCHCPDPDLVIRTSGEYRLSNFLLWQLAYSEMIFLSKQWPEVEREDLLTIIRAYSSRRRRFGK